MAKTNLKAKQKADKERMRRKREDPEFRVAEKIKITQNMAKKRNDPDFIAADRSRCAQNMAEKRKDPDFVAADNSRRAQTIAEKRGNEDFNVADRTRRALCLRKKRETDPEFNAADRTRSAKAMAEKRKDLDFAAADNSRRAQNMAEKRGNEDFNVADKTRRAFCLRKKRNEDPEFNTADRTRSAQAMSEKRKDPGFIAADNSLRAQYMAERRKDPDFTAADNSRRALSMTEKRKDPYFTAADNCRRALNIADKRKNEDFNVEDRTRRAFCLRKKRTEDPEFNAADKTRRKSSRIIERRDPVRRVQENANRTPLSKSQQINENTRRSSSIQANRQLDEFRTPERQKDASRRSQLRQDAVRRKLDWSTNAESNRRRRQVASDSFSKLLAKYKATISKGPTFICSCCGSLFYEESTRKTSKEALQSLGLNTDFIGKVLCVPQLQDRLCTTCLSYIKKEKVPRWCLKNGLDFQPIPDELKGLNRLEERLVALRLPFMQIRLRGYERQWALKGNVVNVENNLDTTVSALPRQFHEADVVQLKLMRKMTYRGHYIYDKIRPANVVNAVKYLLETPLYKKANVVLSENWNNFDSDEVDFLVDEDNDSPDDRNTSHSEQNDGEDETGNIGAEETLLLSETDTGNYGIKIAPGEKNVPIPLNRDPEAELLSFPKIYAGQERKLNPAAHLTYTKSELRRYDRRCATPEKILYMYKYSCNEKIFNAYQIMMRQKKKGRDGKAITAKDIRSPGFIDNAIAKDDGYSVFKSIRSSPAYWKEQTKRVVSMVRQLGNCTFFITLSAAETKWNELLVVLSKVVKNRDISEEEAARMSFEDKAELIRLDPVTCMRHFEHKYRAFLTDLLKKDSGVFRPHKVVDHYSRIEFQMRGSPHSHGLYWLDNAPKYIPGSEESAKKCIAFVDKFITCKRDEEGDMENLIGYQIHNHSHTCWKGGRSTGNCRFGFPKPPLPTTLILHPLPKDIEKDAKKHAQNMFKKISLKLVEMGRSFKENIEFQNFLQSLDLNFDDYVLAIRSSLRRSSVMLKRQTSEIFVNNYNKDMLQAWRANMDIQFVLDTYACAKYCVGYMLKAEGGVSKLLRAACREARSGNKSVQDKVKQFAKILINGAEISAQDAAAFILGIPNTSSSRVDVYINTAKASDRISMLKPRDKLDLLQDDSEDLYEKGPLDHYVQRPEELENVCLADFAALYTYSSKQSKGSSTPRAETEEECSLKKTFNLLDGSGFVTKRKVRKIIRFRHFQKTDQMQYWREQLMLFVPWRDESAELVNIDSVLKAEEVMTLIKENSKPYYDNQEIDDGILGSYINEIENDEDEQEQQEVVENDMQLIDDDNYADSFLTGTRTKSSVAEKFLPPKWIPNDEYNRVMRTLNNKQRRIVMEVIHRLKDDKDPFHIFLTGGAGVGKSRVITAITQTYLRYCNKFDNLPTEDINVIVSAPTGKAAFNVFGMTLHCAFKLPPTQFGGDIPKLDASSANTLRLKFKNTKLFIIDEISMVSARQFAQIDQRLRDIFNTEEPFGGKSILVVGHLRQLPPIPGGRSHYLFKPPPSSRSALVSRNPLWSIFEFYELTEIMRQRGDEQRAFCVALNNMAEGEMTQSDVSLLKSREIETNNLEVPVEAIWLFEYNKDCREHNANIHALLHTEGATSTAYDQVTGSAEASQRNRFLEDAKTFTPQESDGIPYETHLQIGGVYMVTTNIDVSDGLFNGATGMLKKIEHGTTVKGERIPSIAWMLFENEIIGSSQRNNPKYQNKYLHSNIPKEWTPIERITRTLSVSHKYSGMELIRNQLPLLAANAMTIAKAQGSSLMCVVVSTKRKLSREKLYVACSRATSLGGLFISGKFSPPEKPSVDDPVSLEMEILKKCPVLFTQQFFTDITSPHKFYYHNVENFKCYKGDLESDPNIMSANIIGLVEPHIKENMLVELEDFQLHGRWNSGITNGFTNSEGFLLYKKGNLDLNLIPLIKRGAGNANYTIVEILSQRMTLFLCYRHKNYSPDEFLNDLKERIIQSEGPITVVGDFNIDLIRNQHCNMVGFFHGLGLRNVLPDIISTTNLGTYIDLCFSNSERVKAFIYETYYSAHKAVCIYWE